MNMGQMMLVVLAVALFTTIIMGVNHNFQNQLIMAGDNIYNTQALKVADYIFQRFEVDLITDQIPFQTFFNHWNIATGGGQYPEIVINNASYFATIEAIPINAMGAPITSFSPDRLRLNIRIRVEVGGRVLNVGTAAAPFTKNFTNVQFSDAPV